MIQKPEQPMIPKVEESASQQTPNDPKKRNSSLKSNALSIEKTATSWAKRFKNNASQSAKKTKENYQKIKDKTLTKEQKSKHKIDTGIAALTSAANGVVAGVALTIAGIAHATQNISGDDEQLENEPNKNDEQKNQINTTST